MNLEEKYNLLCQKLRQLFSPMTSNICLICKHYKPCNINTRLNRVIIEDAPLHIGCTIPGGKCLFDPDEEKLLDA